MHGTGYHTHSVCTGGGENIFRTMYMIWASNGISLQWTDRDEDTEDVCTHILHCTQTKSITQSILCTSPCTHALVLVYICKRRLARHECARRQIQLVFSMCVCVRQIDRNGNRHWLHFSGISFFLSLICTVLFNVCLLLFSFICLSFTPAPASRRQTMNDHVWTTIRLRCVCAVCEREKESKRRKTIHWEWLWDSQQCLHLCESVCVCVCCPSVYMRACVCVYLMCRPYAGNGECMLLLVFAAERICDGQTGSSHQPLQTLTRPF